MKKKKLIVFGIALLILIAIGSMYVAKTYKSGNTNANIFEALEENGYQGTIGQLLISLSEETVLEDTVAYDEAVSNNYSGSYEDWLNLFLTEADIKENKNKDSASKSSFDYALENGFNGSEEEWNDCFTDIKNDKSAYEMCVDKEFSGNRINWLEAINVESDSEKSIYKSSKNAGFKGTEIDWIAYLLDSSNNYCNKIEATYPILTACGYNKDLSVWLKEILGDRELEDKSVLLYGLAVENGYKKSYAEWLKELIQSPDGNNSVYDQLVADGYNGTKQELMDAIKSSKNVDELYQKLVEKGYKGTKEELIVLLGDEEESNDTEEETDNNNGTTPTLTVSNASAISGDKSITVKVSVKNNPGILGMKLTLDYDEDVLVLKSASNGSALSDVLTLTKPKSFSSGCNFGWDGVRISENEIKDGSVLELSFDVKETAKSGSYPIRIHYKKSDIVGNDLKPISFDVTDGTVNIKRS